MPLVSREVILAKKEVTYNVDPVPTAVANGILIANPSWAHEGLRMNERNSVKDTNAVRQHIFGGTLRTITMECELKGSGSATVPPEFGVLFEASSMIETIGGSDVQYAPTSDTPNQESVTIYYYQDGLLLKMTGCRGTYSVNLETGALPVITFTMTGHTGDAIDATIASPTLDTTVPVGVKGTSFSVDGFSAQIGSFTFDAGIEVITPSSMSDPTGYGEVYVGKRDCNGSFDPEMELVATHDFYGKFTAGEQMVMTTGNIGTVAGNIFKIDMPAIYYRDASNGDRDGVRTYEMPFGAVESSGDDEVKFTFS